MMHFTDTLGIQREPRSKYDAPDPDDIMQSLKDVFPQGTAAVVLSPWAGRPVQACIDPLPLDAPAELAFQVAYRLLAWISNHRVPRAVRIPDYLTAWLPFDRAVIVPIDADGRRIGAFVVDSTRVDRGRLEALTLIAKDVADRAATADRMAAISKLAKEIFPHPVAPE